MGLISQTYPFVANAIPTAANWNSNWTTVLAEINGQLDSANFDMTDAYSWSGAHTFTSGDVTWNDNVKATFGTGGDADVYYDATNLVINPKVVGSGYVDVQGDVHVGNGNGLVVGHTAQVTAGATSEFQVLGTATADASISLGRWSADAGGPQIHLVKSRNATVGSSTIVQNGDFLGGIFAYPDDGADFTTPAGDISILVDDATPAENQIGSYWRFRTATTGGTVTEAMRIDSSQHVTLGGTSSIGSLPLEVHTSADATNVGIYSWSTTDAQNSSLRFFKSASATIGTFAETADNEELGEIDWFASDSGNTQSSIVAQIIVEQEGAAGAANVPARMIFSTSSASGSTEAMRIDSAQSVMVGTGAIATTATDGFLYIPSCAGTPTGAPTDHSNLSAIVHDTTNNRIYLYDHVSNAWQYAALT